MNVVRHADFPSQFVAARNADVWLPPDCAEDGRHPVLYMHDGQNLFGPVASIGGVAWEVDKARGAGWRRRGGFGA
ncbi:MAG: hypothetical protein MZV64_22975 [Ignavibacteriales bacterium]|nr:hypothetical protein [Ignavibacteriales bacterium]